MMIVWIGAAVLLGIITWRVFAASRSPRSRKGPSSTPEDVLRERYARGEIDDAEYERRMSALHH